jgi:hypothetical protein
MRSKWQFSFSAPLIALVLAGLAAAVIRMAAKAHHTPATIIAIFTAPLLLCGAIGVLFGRLDDWMKLGALIAIAGSLYLTFVRLAST